MGLEWIIQNYRGELAALTAALLWAIAAAIFVRLGSRVAPLVMNWVKGLVALGLLGVTLLLWERPFPEVTPLPICLLLLSGVLGIGLGDTFYFRALGLIGARRSLLLESIAPPLSALLALVFLGETLNGIQGLGIALTLAGVAWVVSEQLPSVQAPEGAAALGLGGNRGSPRKPEARSRLLAGVGYGLLAAGGQAGGAVLSRAALADTAMDPLWSALLRLGASVVLLSAWMLGVGGVLGRPAFPRLNRMLVSLGNSDKSDPEVAQTDAQLPELPWKSSLSLKLVGAIALTAVFSTYLGIWLQQTALKHTSTGIAQALTSTSPLFILPIAWVQGDRLSGRALGGVLLSLLGIVLLFS